MEYLIERLGHHGDGIADGPVYAALTLPNETVSGRLEGETLKDVKILSPSDHRVRPACKHFKACGGCQLMHADDVFVANWKTEIVRKSLEMRGIETVFRDVQTSPPQSRRRASFAARRTKTGVLAGFHGRGSDTIIDISDCHVIHAKLRPILEFTRALVPHAASRKAKVVVQATVVENGVDVAIQGGKPMEPALFERLGHLARDYDIVRIAWDGETVVQEAPPQMRFGPLSVSPPAGAFCQATKPGEAALVEAVLEALGDCKGPVVDLFSGCGTFTGPVAETAEVHAIEGDRTLIYALQQGVNNTFGIKKIITHTRDLFRNPLTSEELRVFEAAVIDPPRAGALAQVTELARSGVEKIAFVSCNPVTFARDAEILRKAGYYLDWVQVVDQFRWSAHVELAASFRLAHR